MVILIVLFCVSGTVGLANGNWWLAGVMLLASFMTFGVAMVLERRAIVSGRAAMEDADWRRSRAAWSRSPWWVKVLFVTAAVLLTGMITWLRWFASNWADG